MSIPSISDAEAGSSVRTKLNDAIIGSMQFGQIRDRFYAFSDLVTLQSSAISSDHWVLSTAGTGAAATAVAPGSINAIGLVRFDVGSATARAGYTSNITVSALQFGLGRARFQARLAVPTLSNGTDGFSARVGFLENLSGDSTDGVYFRYTDSVNSGKWECVCRSNGTETAADSGVAAVAGGMKRFLVDVNAAGTSAAFYMDGTLVQTITTNIPTGSGRETGYGVMAVKTLGTTVTQVLLLDYVEVEYLFTTAR